MAKLTTAEFIDAIKELSVLELNDLVKARGRVQHPAAAGCCPELALAQLRGWRKN